MDAISHMSCIACEMNGGTWSCGRVEVHHLVDKGTRKLSGGHDATVPLGAWHHRGVVPRGQTALGMMGRHGPSMALQGKAFTARYGTQRQLLAKVDAKLRAAGVIA